MKIKRYDKQTAGLRDPGAATVYLHYTGNFSFNEAASLALGIKSDSKHYVELIQDEEYPKDWYVAITNAETGLYLRPGKKSNNYQFNSGIIAKAILKTLPKTDAQTSPKTASLLLSTSPIEYDGLKLYPIITSSFKPKK